MPNGDEKICASVQVQLQTACGLSFTCFER